MAAIENDKNIARIRMGKKLFRLRPNGTRPPGALETVYRFYAVVFVIIITKIRFRRIKTRRS